MLDASPSAECLPAPSPRALLPYAGLSLLAITALPAGATESPEQARPAVTPIKHLVIIFRENESFDHGFATCPHVFDPRDEPTFIAEADTPPINGPDTDLLEHNRNASAAANGPNKSNPFRPDRSQAHTEDPTHNCNPEQLACGHGAADLFPRYSGLCLFTGSRKADCAGCHANQPSPGHLPPLLTDTPYETMPVPSNTSLPINKDPGHDDPGLCGHIRRDMAAQTQCQGMFLTPTLHNTARRGVYFQNGVYHDLLMYSGSGTCAAAPRSGSIRMTRRDTQTTTKPPGGIEPISIPSMRRLIGGRVSHQP